MYLRWTNLAVFTLSSLLLAGIASAGEKKLMHCFAFTPIEDASEADWEAFYKATDELPDKVEGFNKVWYGKLRRPMRLYYKTGGDEAKYEQRVREWNETTNASSSPAGGAMTVRISLPRAPWSP